MKLSVPSLFYSSRAWQYLLLGSMLLLAAFFAQEALAQVGLSKWRTETLEPQAKDLGFILNVVAAVIGAVFLLIGFIKLIGQQKGQAFLFIVVGALLLGYGSFALMASEAISGKEATERQKSILDQ